ncbi:RNA-directed DNA polymerase, partial [Dichomitus squalens LYAD-421 SS1]
CLDLGYWPHQFKEAVLVVISKPKKADYSVLKAFRPIALLSCIGKLFEKALAARLQFDGQKYGLLHPMQ